MKIVQWRFAQVQKIVLAVIALVVGCSSAFAGPKEDALLVVQKWGKAFVESDVDGILKLYAPNALFFGTGSQTLVTRPEDVRRYFEQALLVNRPKSAEFGDHTASVISDTVVVVSGLDAAGGVRDGKAYSAKGRVTFVLAKTGSEWLIVQFHRSALPS